MNREESVEVLKDMIDYQWGFADFEKPKSIEAIQMGIESLENQKTIQEELEKLKAEFEEIKDLRDNPYTNKTEYSVSMKELREVFDKHIAELKGE